MELMQLVYRSLAVERPSTRGLQRILEVARRRNATEGLTGLLVHDQGCFVQWLEGPPDGLDRVWESIRRDRRHEHIERLHTPWRAERLFPDWTMQLGALADSRSPHNALEIDVVAAREVHATPDRAALLLPSLSLEGLVPATATMLAWSIAADDGPWRQLTERLAVAQPRLWALSQYVFGPLTRALGDAWSQDTVDTTDILIGITRMQAMLHQVGIDRLDDTVSHRKALVACMPGETHIFGVSFAALALHAQGWHVECCFPADAAALLAELRRQPFDALHVALSDSFTREHRLAELAALMRSARRESLRPQMQILLSGRAFAQQPGLAQLLGADGDGVAQKVDGTDLDALIDYADRRRHSPAMMFAQATLNDVMLQIQRRRFGIPEEGAAGRAAATKHG